MNSQESVHQPPADPAAHRDRIRQEGEQEHWLGLGASKQAISGGPHAKATSTGTLQVLDRRRFLSLMAASTALAGLQGCRRPDIEILPYAKMPEVVTPGMPLFYATSLVGPAGARPVLVETHEGRPTKIEGHPDHPFSQGATDLLTQANILELYDPDRSRQVRHEERASTWEEFDAFVSGHFEKLILKSGEGLRFLCDGEFLRCMPALGLLRQHLRTIAPKATWHQYSPYEEEYVETANRIVFGRPVKARYQFNRAKVIVALDADFLGIGEANALPYTRDFVDGREPTWTPPHMNRLYIAEPMLTVTGGMADHRLRLPRSEILSLAVLLALELGIDLGLGDGTADPKELKAKHVSPNIPRRWIEEIAADLQDNRSQSIVMAGRAQPPAVHALVHLINDQLDNLNKTATFLPDQDDELLNLRALVDRIDTDDVDTLVILGGNPAYDAPIDLQFAEKLKQIPTTIRFGLFEDETSQHCSWHLPAAHTFESWGDAETPDSNYSPMQPLTAPLFGGRSWLEFVARLTRYELTEPYEIAQRSFAERNKQGSENSTFEKFLHEGLLLGKQLPVEEIEFEREPAAAYVRELLANCDSQAIESGEFELTFHLDSSLYDGRFANNGWLQEVPDPVTKLTWDNAALISPNTARQLDLSTGDIVRLSVEEHSLEIPVMVAPGQADRSLSVALGYGRTQCGHIGNGVGFNAYVLRTSTAPFAYRGIKIANTGYVHEFACTQTHWALEGRDLVRESPLANYLGLDGSPEQDHRGPKTTAHGGRQHDGSSGATAHDDHHASDLIDSPPLTGKHQWGMAIDLNRCTGCSACMVACQSENNIPIVGKQEVANGRSMHWIRIDRYFRGNENDPSMMHQPVACVHCENAPCETVCPVNAVVHSPEGLNLQVYNRCVGTRYCSNNCPYKVRRFNWFDYQQRPLDQLRLGPLASKGSPETLKMQKNPDVTVRMRGIMEKCTYCVQRIERAKTGVKLANPTAPEFDVPDGTITPACAQACPAKAIVFGSVSDVNSEVSRQKLDLRHFGLLDELGTQPRTTYLARVRNPNLHLLQALSAEGNQPT